MPQTIMLGCAGQDITPQKPLPLAGFTFRHGPFESIESPLSLQAYVFTYPDGKSAVLLSADIIWWGKSLIESCTAALRRHKGLSTAAIFFQATHTHYAPHTASHLHPLLGAYSQEYSDFVAHGAAAACRQALDNRIPVHARLYQGASSIPINRRRLKDGVSFMAPNPDGLCDRTLSLLEFYTPEKSIALMAHLACHPTTSGQNIVSAEFLSKGLRAFASSLPHSPLAAFLQGFSGDVRPPLIKDNEFYRGLLDKESNQLSDAFCKELAQCYHSAPKEIIFENSLVSTEKHFTLPLGQEIDHSSFQPENEVQEWWLSYFRDNDIPKSMPTRLSYWKMAQNLSFLFSDGEVVTEYGLYAKKCSPSPLLCCGVSNGILGYIPSKEYIPQKGLEAYDSIFYFLIPQPFALETEDIFKKNIKEIIQQ